MFALLPVVCAQAQAQAQTQTPAVPADQWHYRIANGDTLIDIAANYLIKPEDWPQLQRLNQIADPRRLVPGSFVHIPVAWVQQQAAVAEVVFVQGAVTLTRAQATEPQVLTSGTTVKAGDTLSTGPQASVTLRFADSSRLLLTPNSTATVVHLLTMGRTANVPSVRMTLQDGSTEIRVAPNPSTKRSFEVQTPVVNLGVRGTDFRARVDAQQQHQTWLEVLEGQVGANKSQGSGDTEKSVQNGQGLVAQANQPLKPPAALLQAPNLSNLATQLDRVPLRFAWPTVAGASAYRAQIFQQQQPDQLLLDERFTQAAAKWTDLPDGHYVLRVRGQDANGLDGRSTQHSFVLKARPEPPFTQLPSADATVAGEAVQLSWTQAANAQRYRVQVAPAQDGFGSSSLIDQPDVTQTSHTLRLAPGVYQWRIASLSPSGDQGPFGDPSAFTLRTLPATPDMQAPQANETGIVFRWPTPQEGQKVRYQVAKEASFSTLLVDTTTDQAQGTLAKPGAGRYFIRAKTIDPDGFEGAFGAVQQVQIKRSSWWMLLPPVVLGLFL
jgi:hypothetical protein